MSYRPRRTPPLPSATPRKDADELFVELEALDEALRAKLEHATPAANDKYTRELAPALVNVRKLVNARAPRARNAVDDLLVKFRELMITSNANIVKAHF